MKVYIVNLGYSKFGFDNQAQALEFFRLASTCAQLKQHWGQLPDGRKDVEYIRADDEGISINSVDSSKVEGECTLEELKAMYAKKADVDVDATVKPEPTVLEVLGYDTNPPAISGTKDDDIGLL